MKEGTSEPLEVVLRPKIHNPNPESLLGRVLFVYSAAVSDRASVNTTKLLNSKPPKVASSRASKSKGHG
jgi:hypothetical protein